MKLNINLECFAKRKDPFTEKTKCLFPRLPNPNLLPRVTF